MDQCPSLPRCYLLNEKLAKMPAAVDMIKMRYCSEEGRACARWMVISVLGPEWVPPNLFPHELERARLLLAEHR